MRVSYNGGTPKLIVYKGKSNLEMDDSGVAPYVPIISRDYFTFPLDAAGRLQFSKASEKSEISGEEGDQMVKQHEMGIMEIMIGIHLYILHLIITL